MSTEEQSVNFTSILYTNIDHIANKDLSIPTSEVQQHKVLKLPLKQDSKIATLLIEEEHQQSTFKIAEKDSINMEQKQFIHLQKIPQTLLQQEEESLSKAKNITFDIINIICNDETRHSSLLLDEYSFQEHKSTSLRNSVPLKITTQRNERCCDSLSPARSKSNFSPLKKHSTKLNRQSEHQSLVLNYSESVFQKKSSRYMYIKDLEDKRVQKIAIFLSIFNNINDSLQKITTESNSFIENLLIYFKDCQNQQASSSNKIPLCQMQDILSFKPEISKESQNSINTALKLMKDLEKHHQGNSNLDLQKFTENSSILLLNGKAKFDFTTNFYGSILKEKKQKIHKLEKITANAFWDYSQLFKQVVEQQSKGNKDKPKDQYNQELKYMYEYIQLLDQVKEFGIQVGQYVRELSTLQQMRVKQVANCLHQYTEKKKELGTQKINLDINLTLSDLLSLAEASSYLLVEKLLQPEQSHYIRRCYELEKGVDEKILEMFSKDFEMNPTSIENSLLIGSINAMKKNQQQDGGGINDEDFEVSQLLFTLDRYLLVIQNINLIKKMQTFPQIIDQSPLSTNKGVILNGSCNIPDYQASQQSSYQIQNQGSLSPKNQRQNDQLKSSTQSSFTKPTLKIYLPYFSASFNEAEMTITFQEVHKKHFWSSKMNHIFKLTNHEDYQFINSLARNNWVEGQQYFGQIS